MVMNRTVLARGHYFSGAAAESDRDCALRLASGRQDQLILILEEASSLTGRKLNRFLAAPADLEQRTQTITVRGGQRTGSDQAKH